MAIESNTNTSQPSRHERQQRKESDKRFLLRQIMNVTFIAIVAVLIVLYFVRPGIQSTPAYIILGLFAVLVKIAEMIIRFLPK